MIYYSDHDYCESLGLDVIQINSLINKDPPDYDYSSTSTLKEGNRSNSRDKLKKTGS